MKIINLTFFLIITALHCFAQHTITGCIISQADTKPVANANVFLSNATNGDHTNTDGTFKLTKVKPGQYELVISIIGFDTYNQTVTVTKDDIDLQTITIYPKTISLKEVKIKPGTDFNRQRNYEWFKDEFLGKSELAKECKILNPEVIDLNYDDKTGTLTASSVDFLIIRNNALGFKIKYLLKDFTLNNADEMDKAVSYSGAVLFEFLKGSLNEEQQWQKQRQEVYNGSVAHFLRSALADKLDKEGFRVLRLPANPERPADKVIEKKIETFQALKADPHARDSLAYWMKKSRLPKRLERLLFRPLKKEEFIEGPGKQDFFTLSNINDTVGNVNDALFVSYSKDHRFGRRTTNKLSDPENKENTLIIFDKADVFFDRNGNINDPKSLTYEGIWSRNRMAGMLPLDYEPDEANTMPIDSALVKSIDTKLSQYTASQIMEKAYLHFDKPYYAAGDTVYFKAYITDGELHTPTNKSGVLYVDLIGGNNKLSRSVWLPIIQGTAWGSFALPDSLAVGDYHIKACTRLMQGDTARNYFVQKIEIGGTATTQVPESGAAAKIPQSATASIQFFPEGGSLVTGLKTKIAFKAIAAEGYGIGVKGTIIDNNGKELTTFAAEHLGMGYFYLLPGEGKTYRAKLTYNNGTQGVIDLPRSTVSGIGMEITGSNNSYSCTIRCSKAYCQANKGKLYTIITYSGGLPFSVTFKLDKPEITEVLPKQDMRMGIAKTTLFASSGEPLCERLLFVHNGDLQKLNLTGDQATYTARQKVTMQLKAGDGGRAVAGQYSVSVTDESKVNADELAEPTIINNLLLTSELKGYIEQPNYYFNSPNDKTDADLDLVMLTHGYRQFEWKQILYNSAKPVAPSPETGLAIAGRVVKSGKAVPNAKIRLFTRGNINLVVDTIADADGRFVFNNLSFSDSTKFVLQARSAKGDKNVDVEPDKLIASSETAELLTPVRITNGEALSTYMHNNKLFKEEQSKYGINRHMQMLKEVTIKGKKEDPLLTHSENLNGKGNADQVITSKWLEESGYTNLYDALRAKANFVDFNPSHQVISKHALGTDLMEIIVDGTPLDQPHKPGETSPLEELSTNEVESIEIGLGAHYGAIYGSRAAGGVIIITTKRAKKQNLYYREAPGVIVYTAKGFYKAREFYSPQYDNPHTNQKMADLRSTIYWNPNIITDKDGKASFSYFNADGKGTYRVVIEGIDTDGNLGRQVFKYKVE